jgi:phosphoserine/homoserine phosphotransferase
MYIICSDLESVFLPEMWVEVANATGIEDLKLTTRDISDLNVLMEKRLKVLKENKIDINTLMSIAEKSEPLPGALETLNWMREKAPVVILSDGFWQMINPVLKKLNYPTILCNLLKTDADGVITGYEIREDGKRKTVKSFKELGMKTVAMGDSYNDIKMLNEADLGFFFNTSQKITEDFPNIPSIKNYKDLKDHLTKILK